jgi:small subunit ribosomal protein S17e
MDVAIGVGMLRWCDEMPSGAVDDSWTFYSLRVDDSWNFALYDETWDLMCIRPTVTLLRFIIRVLYLTLLCSFCFALQGVRTKTVKKSARTIVEKYYTRLTLDFHTNKRIVDDVAILPSKRMRNKIAGYTTHLMRRIAKGPVRGISLKLQEEERERRLDFVPEVSALEQETIQIDPDTRDLLESLGYGNLNGVAVNASAHTRE